MSNWADIDLEDSPTSVDVILPIPNNNKHKKIKEAHDRKDLFRRSTLTVITPKTEPAKD